MKLHIRSNAIANGKAIVDTGEICKGYHPTQSNFRFQLELKDGNASFWVSPENIADALELQRWIGEYIDEYK